MGDQTVLWALRACRKPETQHIALKCQTSLAININLCSYCFLKWVLMFTQKYVTPCSVLLQDPLTGCEEGGIETSVKLGSVLSQGLWALLQYK